MSVVGLVGSVFVVVSFVAVGCLQQVPRGVFADKNFSSIVVTPVDNINATSEQCHDKYDITILTYSSLVYS